MNILFCLESENLVLELANVTSLGEAETLSSLLQAVNHRRGTTEEDLDIAGGLGEVLLVHVLVSTGVLNATRTAQRLKEKRTVIISAVTKPTPPVQPSGGLSST